MNAPSKFSTELVDVAGYGVVIGFIGRRHLFFRLIDRHDLAQDAGDAGKRARAAFGFTQVVGLDELGNVLDRRHLALDHVMNAQSKRGPLFRRTRLEAAAVQLRLGDRRRGRCATHGMK